MCVHGFYEREKGRREGGGVARRGGSGGPIVFQFLTTLTRAVERKNRKFRGVNDVQREREREREGEGNYRLRRRNDERTIPTPMFTALVPSIIGTLSRTMAVREQAFREINRGYYDRAAERIPSQTAG